jgi:hypothetical protein
VSEQIETVRSQPRFAIWVVGRFAAVLFLQQGTLYYSRSEEQVAACTCI